jgi:aldose 1-epimerase
MTVRKTKFGTTTDGLAVDLYECRNRRGAVLKLSNYGATIVALEVPDRNGRNGNIVLGFDSVNAYEEHDAYFGATIGRYGNRIARGRFALHGKDYILATNNGENHLHGGDRGFDKVVWEARPETTVDAAGIEFTYTSPDGEEGYPGTLVVTVTYLLGDDNALSIEYAAVTDKTTVVNLTNHAYWNLSAGAAPTILDHVLMLAADRYVAVNDDLIPTGIADVTNSAMDFSKPTAIGAQIDLLPASQDDPRGFDHCYVLRNQNRSLALAARLHDPQTGRSMEVHTTEPGIQFYTSNSLDGGEADGGYPQHAAVCLETQHYPDSPNQPNFPSVRLEPGETWRSKTVYRFV